MKKLLLIVMLCWGSQLMAQSGRTAPEADDENGSCPPGFCPSLVYTLETFNFHKPRTNCTSGFGLCIRIGIRTRCSMCDAKATLRDNMVSAVFLQKGTKVEVRLPLALRSAKGFEKTDMSVFELEEKTLSIVSPDGKEVWVKGGIYPVARTETEYIIMMETY